MIKFSIGMPTYDDFDGVYFTLHALWLYHRDYIHEVIIIDNKPKTRTSERIRDLAAQCHRTLYIPYEDSVGTAPAKNQVFANANSEYVLCIDSHILLVPGCLEALSKYYEANPKSQNLLQGPLLADNQKTYFTHLNEVWGSDVRGGWEQPLPVQRELQSFPINNMGTGFLCSRKDAWQGFNPLFKGFGGEEWYIQRKYQKAGYDAICIQAAKWIHRFADIKKQPPYPLNAYDRVRNYYIGLKELGEDTQQVYNHYVNGGVISPLDWQGIVEGKDKPCPTCGQTVKYPTLQDWHDTNCGIKGDINEHLDTLRKLARHSVVVDCGDRPQLTMPAFALGGAKSIWHLGNKPQYFDSLIGMYPSITYTEGTSLNTQPIECDLLFIDTDPHDKKHVLNELDRWHSYCKHYIVLHDTVSFPGVLEAVRAFVRENTEWTVIESYTNNNGLVVLSCVEDDKKQPPSLLRKAWNYSNSLALHMADGASRVTDEVFNERIATCDTCKFRNGDDCGQCGCTIQLAASWKTKDCPLGYWKQP